MINKACAIFLFLFLSDVSAQGDRCTTKAGQPGSCINIRRCPSAVEDIKRRINPQICGFEGTDPIVCCADASGNVLTTSTQRSTSTTIYIPPIYDYQTNNGDGTCEPLGPERTAPKNGRKAWDKCVDYQRELVFPCVKGPALTGEKARVDRCGHGADELIVGGQDTTPREFPHMVLLGYGDTAESAQWLCGGTLVSDRFVLTAGHCTISRDNGDVSFVRLGAHKRTDQVAADRLYRVGRIIKHPSYKSPVKYNDIALLQTQTTMKLDQYAVPACLHIGDDVRQDKAVATGWGSVIYNGPTANTLQKVTLNKFSTPECTNKFPEGTRNMLQGFNSQTQLCYGDKREKKDTCQGDSGGPLQIKNNLIKCMYTVIGVTSFGGPCGFEGEPGIYTRVAAFTPWIESIVWP